MKLLSLVSLLVLLNDGLSFAQVEQKALASLTSRIGTVFWSPPEKRLVRATTYKKGRQASDSGSAHNKGDERIGLRYASDKEAGTLAAPQWLPRGSMVKIHTEHGVLSYIAADQGSGVEAGKAAKESGKTDEQKAAPVLDFCAAEQLWPDFIIVEIYYYAGKIPFSELSLEEQTTMFIYAMEYVTKRE
ncbi:MAG: hypothetical protein WCF18_19685 [Chthoniobacteraceae bacterium]